ncbi:hypothetical protein TVAG_226240 [Trichomonas vaginalis G3]|uniref:DUF3447 domain-containing protein n=1 Tax=Trichomonas vaginalis (strain ATCC PRA-98 / G3) TaxID=412133 RepID=A2G5D1_TRIV3|nr:protein kinase protein [Trichomonas vaginalis G3]EAX87642.1 hypothetical protein TVAG_226240 [Trichomonas vaginalis G3]KAI5552803.1 protein kinase protein [Trichomonas vaginalis G3]|eukprot:XP_001300572.1 hypothetical protein [Trichomonas vaginalis G3]
MSDQGINTNEYRELRSDYKYYIDSYNAMYRLKTENDDEINSIYEMIKTELIDSKKHYVQTIIRDVLNMILYNNRYTKSYLKLAKLIYDDNNVKEVHGINSISNFLFHKEYDIILDKTDNFKEIELNHRDIHSENPIYRAIMNDDIKNLIDFTERNEFDEDQKLKSKLYPYSKEGYSLLELCCYHGAVDCFKFLRTKCESEITDSCLQLSFLGGNPEIISECLKSKKPNKECMKYTIISHNIDFVTFLMNEHNIVIDLEWCGAYDNLESFLVYFDQIKDFNECFIHSTLFNIPPFSEYFFARIKDINIKNQDGQTPLHYAAMNNSKDTAELLISHGANINEKDKGERTPLHYAAMNNSKETAGVLFSHGANINEKDIDRQTPLHHAVMNNRKDTAELLISHGANINEKGKGERNPLHHAAMNNSKDTAELIISHGANINENDINGKTALRLAV